MYETFDGRGLIFHHDLGGLDLLEADDDENVGLCSGVTIILRAPFDTVWRKR